ncbi:MAG: carboxypeptidase regulatory-like domain-containing protein [Acidobacteriota bacterium]|nr:carboxypeptidase regulatory-like domain-containing protein [Acidobacteriota bacterium]
MFSFILLLSLAVQPFVVQNFFSVIGTVRDETGHPISSIRVSLEDENSQPIRTVFTDSSGRFQFPGLRAGNYRLRAETAGLPYEENSQPVELQSLTRNGSPSTTEEPTLYDITLKRKKSAAGSAPGVVFAQVIPPPAREEYNRGASSIKKDPEVGILALKKAIEIFPDYYDALELLGTEYLAKGQFDNAIPILLRAVEINDKAFKSMYGLGVAFLNLKRLEESINWLQKAAAGDPTNADAFMKLGIAQGNNGSLSESETTLKKAYQLGLADAHLYLAGIYNKQERFGEAWRQLELYLKEAKGLKDKTQISEMITKLKAKEKAKQ